MIFFRLMNPVRANFAETIPAPILPTYFVRRKSSASGLLRRTTLLLLPLSSNISASLSSRVHWTVLKLNFSRVIGCDELCLTHFLSGGKLQSRESRQWKVSEFVPHTTSPVPNQHILSSATPSLVTRVG